jgi:hypothetical protein
MKRSLALLILSMLPILAGSVGGAAEPAKPPWPDLDYFHVPAIPLDGQDAPAICNHWLWAQAGTGARSGILNMEDVRPGAQKQFHGTTLVSVNGHDLKPTPPVADWWPNKVLRRAVWEGVEFEGTVVAAHDRYALLNRLVISNATAQPKRLKLEIAFVSNGGLHGCLEAADSQKHGRGSETLQFREILLPPGEAQTLHTVNLYRGTVGDLGHLLRNFEAESRASDGYWNQLLQDAFTPGPGLLLSGGAPRFVTQDAAAKRFYHFGIITTLMLLKRDLDKAAAANLYVTALPDEAYGTTSYIWDIGYASELLAMMDPQALRTLVERWAISDPHRILNAPYDQPPRPGTSDWFYAANGSMFFFSAWNYLNYTGDYAWLNQQVGDRTILEHLRRAADWHKTRPQWKGLAHYGEERNLFDDITVPGYSHFVAAPNAADVWINRALADIYDQVRHDPATAETLRAEARRIAEALKASLYQPKGSFAGTWKQRHLDGWELKIRHSWDFMCAGSFMAQDLSANQKQQMRDWFMANLVRPETDGRWVVAQDPRDGNNGEHQQEHNGRGAYPAWPYHDGWALHAMGYDKDVITLLRVIQRVPEMGAFGQGYNPAGRRCRSNWANVAGGSAAAYLLHNVFDIWPGLGPFRPAPRLAGFDASGYFESVPVRGKLYRVSSRGAEAQNSP